MPWEVQEIQDGGEGPGEIGNEVFIGDLRPLIGEDFAVAVPGFDLEARSLGGGADFEEAGAHRVEGEITEKAGEDHVARVTGRVEDFSRGDGAQEAGEEGNGGWILVDEPALALILAEGPAEVVAVAVALRLERTVRDLVESLHVEDGRTICRLGEHGGQDVTGKGFPFIGAENLRMSIEDSLEESGAAAGRPGQKGDPRLVFRGGPP